MAVDVIIDPLTGQIYWNDSQGTAQSIAISGNGTDIIKTVGYSLQFNAAPSGFITSSSASTTVTGSGTNFVSLFGTSAAASGAILYTAQGTSIGTISSVTNDTTLVLQSNASGSYLGIPFRYIPPTGTDRLIFSDSSTPIYPATTGANLGSATYRWSLYASTGDITNASPSTVNLILDKSGLGTSESPALQFINTTAATSGSQYQFAPWNEFRGKAWNTTSTASNDVRMRIGMAALSGSAPQSEFVIASSVDTGTASWYYPLTLNSTTNDSILYLNNSAISLGKLLTAGTTSSYALEIYNYSLATSGEPSHWSPAFEMNGSAWNTLTSTSNIFRFRSEVQVATGNPITGTLVWKSAITTSYSATPIFINKMSLSDTSGIGIWNSNTAVSYFKAGSQASDIRYTLPSSAPTINQVLTASTVSGADITLGWTTTSVSGSGTVSAGTINQIAYYSGTSTTSSAPGIVYSVTTTGSLLTLTAQSSFSNPFKISGIVNQSAPLLLVQTSTPTTVFQISSTGVINVGTWNGSTIGLAYGGTNTSAFATPSGLVYFNGTQLVTANTSASGIIATDASFVPFATTSIPTAVTIGGNYIYRVSGNDVAIADGGTNTSAFATPSGLVYFNGTQLVTANTSASGIVATDASFVPFTTTSIPTAVTIGGSYIYRAGGTDIAIADGGTNTSAFATPSGLVYFNGTQLVTANTTVSGIVATDGATIPFTTTSIPTAVTIGGNYIYRAGGTDVPIADGGTGTSTFSSTFGVVFFTGGNLATVNSGLTTQVLVGGGVNAPSFAQVSLTSMVTGTLPLANGGTNTSTFAIPSGLVYFNGSQLVTANTSASGIVATDASFVPFTTTSIPTAVTIGGNYIYRAGGTDIAIADGGTNTSAFAFPSGLIYFNGTQLVTANTTVSGILATDAASVPFTTTSIPTAVTIGGNYIYRAGGTDVTIADGGTGTSSFSSTFGIVFFTGGNLATVNSGLSTQVLVGGGASAPSFAQVNLATMVTGTLTLANGGTGLTNTAPGANYLLGVNNANNALEYKQLIGTGVSIVHTANAISFAVAASGTGTVSSGTVNDIAYYLGSTTTASATGITYSATTTGTLLTLTSQSSFSNPLKVSGILNQSAPLLLVQTSTPTTVFQISSTGIINVGTWNASTIGVAYGGTNTSAFATPSGLVYFNGTQLVTANTSASGIIATDASFVPFATTSIPAAVTIGGSYIYRAGGTDIAIADGGTNTSSFATPSGVVYFNGTQLITTNTTASGILVTNATFQPSIATDIPTAVTIGGNYVYRAGGTDIAIADGGTNTSSFATPSGLVYFNGTQLITTNTTASGILVTNATFQPSIATDIPTAVTIGGNYIYRAGGTDIAIADGGTNTSSFATPSGLVYFNGTQLITTNTTASGILVTNATFQPSIATDIPTAVTIGGNYIYRAGGTDIAIADGGTNTSSFATPSGLVYFNGTQLITTNTTASGILVTNATFQPSIATDIPTAVTIGGNYIYRAGGTDVPTGDGGTGTSSFSSTFGVVFFTGGNLATVNSGLSTQVLVGGGASAPSFAQVNLGTMVTSTLPLANGGTGLTNTAPGANYLLGVNNANNALEYKQLIGTGVSIVHAANSISFAVAASGSGTVSSGTIGQLAYYSGATTTASTGLITYNAAGTTLTIASSSATSNPLKLTTVGSQTGNFFTIENSSATAIFTVSPANSGNDATLKITGTASNQGDLVSITNGGSMTVAGGFSGGRGVRLNLRGSGNQNNDSNIFTITNAAGDLTPFGISADGTTGYGVSINGASSGYPLSLKWPDDATGNTVKDVISIERTTSGVATSGIGARIAFRIEQNAGTTILASSIDSILSNTFVGTFAGAIVFNTNTVGVSTSLVERVRIDNAAVTLSPVGTGAGGTNELRFSELAASGGNYTAFKAPDTLASEIVYTLPSTAPTANQILAASSVSGSSVTLAWATDATGAGGSGTVSSGTNNQLAYYLGSTTTASAAGIVYASATTGSLLTLTAQSSFSNPFKISGIANQSAPLLLVQTSTPTTVFQISSTGIINVGTWNGTNIGLAYGGTNTSAFATPSGLIYYNGTQLVTANTSASGIIATDASFVPFATTSIPTAVTIGGSYIYRASGTDVAIADGGTNTSSFATPSGLVYFNGTQLVTANTSASGIIATDASFLPFSTTSIPTAVTIGGNYIYRAGGTDIAIADGGTNTSSFATPSGLVYFNGTQLITTNTTASGILVTNAAYQPSIATDIPSSVTIGSNYIYRVGGTDISLGDGGTNASLAASPGSVVYGTATAMAFSGVGTSGQALISAGTSAPTFGTLGMAAGGTGLGTTTPGANYILGMTTTNTGLAYKQLVQGTNITISHTDTSVTITASGGSATAGGSNTQIQYNSSNTLAGAANFTYTSPLVSINNATNFTTTSTAGLELKYTTASGTTAVDANSPAVDFIGRSYTSSRDNFARFREEVQTIASSSAHAIVWSSSYDTSVASFTKRMTIHTVDGLGLWNYAGSPGTIASYFKAGNQAADIKYTLPIVGPSGGQVLTATSVAGVDVALGWATPSAGSGSGTVSTGTINQLAYYSGTTTTSSAVGMVYATTATHLTITSQAATVSPLKLAGAASQSAALFTIASSTADVFVVNSSGVISTGNWQATIIPVLYGGTGQSTYTDGQLLIGNSSGNTLTKATLTAGNGIGVSNGNGSISVRTKRIMNMQLASGFNPPVGADSAIMRVPESPTDGSTSLTFNLRNLFCRVETPSAGTTTFQVEYYTGTSAFSGTNLLTTAVSLTGASTYEFTTTGFTTTILTTGTKLRLNFSTVDTTHAQFSINLLLEET